MKHLHYFLRISALFCVIFTLAVFYGCGPSEVREQIAETPLAPVEENPPAEGFDLEGSDAQAITIADEVMEALGGRAAWDSTRSIAWTFFGFRRLYWDKMTHMVRVETVDERLKVIVNTESGDGKVWLDGEVTNDPDSVSKYLEEGKRAWINDSYWLAMPFKLKDSGVTLTHIGTDTTQTGQMADVLQLTFKGVGVTPDNRYEVLVGQESKMVEEWYYYRDATSEKRFLGPFENYSAYGNIKLSGKRGKRELGDIKVLDEVPEGVFDSFEVALP